MSVFFWSNPSCSFAWLLTSSGSMLLHVSQMVKMRLTPHCAKINTETKSTFLNTHKEIWFLSTRTLTGWKIYLLKWQLFLQGHVWHLEFFSLFEKFVTQQAFKTQRETSASHWFSCWGRYGGKGYSCVVSWFLWLFIKEIRNNFFICNEEWKA